jgi:hypothetical protein
MKEGLLWFDDDPGRDLREKIGRAAKRYQKKFGSKPNVCYVHPSLLEDNGNTEEVRGMQVASMTAVLPHHFWLGKETATEGQLKTS